MFAVECNSPQLWFCIAALETGLTTHGTSVIIERFSMTFTANGNKLNFCRLSSTLCTVESKYLNLL